MNPYLILEEYLEYSLGRGLSPRTVRRARYQLKQFLVWLSDKDLRNVTAETVKEYRRHLETADSERTGKPLVGATVSLILSTLKSLFDYLYRRELILQNPLEGLCIRRPGENRLRAIFSESDMQLFLDGIDPVGELQVRNRALFELMYSSGLRAGELLNLKPEHVNLEERILLVKQGKGRKDRYVPFSNTALQFLLLYINSYRKKKEHRLNRTAEYLFTWTGKRYTYSKLREWFRRYVIAAGLDGKGYTMHSIRHATGTHLLNHGAGIRYVQELLGHEDLKTTQLYTRPEADKIKAIYRTYHPRENEYYRDIDDEYLRDCRDLKARLKWGRQRTRQYSKTGHVQGVGKYPKK